MKKASKTQINAIKNTKKNFTDGEKIGHSFFSLKRVTVKHEEHAETKTDENQSKQVSKTVDTETNIDIAVGQNPTVEK